MAFPKDERIRFPRALKPLPVYRGLHWRLECACGVVLNTCQCADGCVPHVEVWQDGCAFVTHWYPPLAMKSAVTHEAPALPPQATPPLHRLTPDDLVAIAKRWRTGDAVAAIAQDFQVTAHTLYLRMRERGVARPHRLSFAAQWATVAQLWQDGMTQTAIGKRYGVTHATVHKLLKRLGLLTQRRSGAHSVD